MGAFKQEVPSPTQDKNSILKQGNASANNGSGNNSEMMSKRVHGIMASNDGNGQNSGELHTQHSMSVGSPEASGNNGTADIISSLQGHQLCHLQQQPNGSGNVPTGGNPTGNALNDFQQLLQENSNHFTNEKLNGNAGGLAGRVMTPPQMDKPLLGGAGYNSDDTRFQYVLAAATSIATKNNEDTLTYLNQGQSYEIKLKKLGDLTNYRNKVLTVRSGEFK